MNIPPTSNPISKQVSQQNNPSHFDRKATLQLSILLCAGGVFVGAALVGLPPLPGVSSFTSRIFTLSALVVSALTLSLVRWTVLRGAIVHIWNNANTKVSFIWGFAVLLVTSVILYTIPLWYFDPYVHRGIPSYTDYLRAQTQQSNWEEERGCLFTEGGFQDSSDFGPDEFHTCIAQNTNFENFVYQVQMTITKGDCGGIAFQVDQAHWHQYLFYICRDARAVLNRYDGAHAFNDFGPPMPLWLPPHLSAINTGLNQSNTIAVVATADGLDLWVNHQQLQHVNDNMYTKGAIGVVAYEFNQPTEVTFSNAQVWKIY